MKQEMQEGPEGTGIEDSDLATAVFDFQTSLNGNRNLAGVLLVLQYPDGDYSCFSNGSLKREGWSEKLASILHASEVQ